MSYTEPARPTAHRSSRVLAAGVVVLIAVVGASLGKGLLDSSPIETIRAGHHRSSNGHHGALGVVDGAVPDDTSVFDDAVPGVAKLDPQLLGAVRRAASDAANDGIEFVVDSGWRSRAYQEQLLREAIAKYGSRDAASRWVATPDTSAHVSGDAIDVGPSEAASWLSAHGTAYGLCQIYANEPWHYELRPEAIQGGCPGMYADASQDPRLQR